MSIWKQIGLTLLALLVAAAIWVRFFPGADQQLARWGLDWVPGAATETGDSGGRGGSPTNERRGPPSQGGVVTVDVLESTINDRLAAIGTGRAARSVTVTPFTSGRMTELLVESGSVVEAGDVIARLERARALRASNTASAVQVTDAELAVDNARLALRDAQLELSRRSVAAPIGGTVGILPIAAGNYVTAQSEIASIEDRSEILVDFWVPERYAGAVSVGSPLTAAAIARPGETIQGSVRAVDNRIDAESRTLHVQARLDNSADRLRAGMSFHVSMRFPGDTYPAVDPLAVQWGADGAFVWAVRNGRAERVAVRIVQRNADSILVDAPLALSDAVVTQGVHAVREGAEVRLASRNGKAAAPETGTPRPASGS
ncbi:MAG: efflux RND transporter periplasmic adaptor subunit [Nitratireductor sp.]